MSDKRYKVIKSDKAMSMLASHVRFLIQVSVNDASKLKAELIKKMKSLDYTLENYPWRTDEYIPPNKYRKKLVSKRYLLIYQIIDDTVYIDYVLDCRQDYGWLI